MSKTDKKRQPLGQPTGGEFAQHKRNDADLSLNFRRSPTTAPDRSRHQVVGNETTNNAELIARHDDIINWLISEGERPFGKGNESKKLKFRNAATALAQSELDLAEARELNPPVEVGSPDGSQVYEIPLTEYLETLNASQIFRATQAEAECGALQRRIDAVLALTGDIGPEARRILSHTGTTEMDN